MRLARFIPVALLLAGVSCSGGRSPATSPPASAPAIAATAATQLGDLSGHWTGSAQVIVQWAKQTDLPIDLRIEPDGRVSGTVGDARLVDARLRTQGLGSPLRVHGKLEGNLIDAEAVRRDASHSASAYPQSRPRPTT